MSDLISRQAAIDTILSLTNCSTVRELYEYIQEHQLTNFWTGGINDAIDAVIGVPPVRPGCDEWCTCCKEYDQEKHCCPRWNRVIRQTVEELKKETPETTRILAEVLNGGPLLLPCDKLWSREGWCKEHCKKGQTEPDTECWLKYAETIAAERRNE